MSEEEFKPISVKSPGSAPFLFKLRCLVDLQLSTIVKPLRPALSQLRGTVLDVGAGESPWQSWLPAATSYQGIDIGNAAEFGMSPHRPDIVYYDGGAMPFADDSFAGVICIEVLEHARDPAFLLAQIARVLMVQGRLILTVPWSARQHHLAHDYHRFTRLQLHLLLTKAGFEDVQIEERGSDISAIANKLTVLTIRLLTPDLLLVLRMPFGLLTAALSAIFVAVAHVADALGWGSRLDPLGYFVSAKKMGLK